jgi:hypothetical protein
MICLSHVLRGMGPGARQKFKDGGREGGVFEHWIRKRRGEGGYETRY